MTHFLNPEESFEQYLIKQMLDEKKIGGQYLDGSQKPGFFLYENKKAVQIFDLDKKVYIPIDLSWQEDLEPFINEIKQQGIDWKRLKTSNQKESTLSSYFNALFTEKSFGCLLAQDFLNSSFSIAEKLIKGGVCHEMKEVETVLTYGFYHLYGPQFPYYCRGETWIP